MAPADERLSLSLRALITHIDNGGIQDTALPGTPTAEATRLTKNGLSVSAFASFEHFVRGRIVELLSAITSSPDLPAFEELPERLQLAATRGVVEALRFRLNTRGDGLELKDAIEFVQEHSRVVATSLDTHYEFSNLSFGMASSNVGAGTLQDFLSACGSGRLFDEIEPLLRDIDFDYSAAGLGSDAGRLRLRNFTAWRHEAAHNATASIDLELLRTRLTAYLAIAFSFDYLASFAVRVLIDSFGAYGPSDVDRGFLTLRNLLPSGTTFELTTLSGSVVGSYYSVAHCADALSKTSLPLTGAVLVRDAQNQVLQWFFY